MHFFPDPTEAPIHKLTKGNSQPIHVGQLIPPENVRQVLIATTWRSGSSFFGDLLTHYPGTYYSFEPLHYNSYNAKTAKPPKELLADIFKCR